MRLLTYILTIISFSFPAWSEITQLDCLNSSFDVSVAHRVFKYIPFYVKLSLKKNGCVIDITHKRFTEEVYRIDVCREPVHIKLGAESDEVLKRLDCELDVSSKYCEKYMDLMMYIQDDGLIYAEGERETLDTPHGKIYCAYRVMKEYLEKGLVLSRVEAKSQASFFQQNEEPVKENVTIPAETPAP